MWFHIYMDHYKNSISVVTITAKRERVANVSIRKYKKNLDAQNKPSMIK